MMNRRVLSSSTSSSRASSAAVPPPERKSEIPDGDSDLESSMDTKSDDETSSPSSSSSPSAKSAAALPSSTSPSSPCPETVIIFDWDDTLLASSFLSSRGYRLDSEMEKSNDHAMVEGQLRELEVAVTSLLTLAHTYGSVHIVTNAETGWVQLSAQKFMPAIVPLLSRVNIISARSTYEPTHPDSPLKWKFCAMLDKLATHYGGDYKPTAGVKKNVISFGDSHVEREAVRAVTRGMPATRCKSVKFAERPSTEQLRRQLELVTNCFHYIHHHDGDLDLQLTVTVNSPSSPSSATSPSSTPAEAPPTPMATTEVA